MSRFWKTFLRQILGMTGARAYALAVGSVVGVAGLLVLAQAERPPGGGTEPTFGHTPFVSAGRTQSKFSGRNLHGRLAIAQSAVRVGSGATFLAEVELTGDADEGDKSAPLALAIVLDHSGSMQGIKIEEAKRAVARFVTGLRDDTFVSFTIYNDGAERVLPLVKVSEYRQLLLDRARSLSADGGTNIPAGLSMGMESLNEAPRNYVRRVVLFSDGLDTSGTPLSNVVSQVRRGAEGGITVSALGIGTDYDPRFMSAVAEAGNGNYAFLGNAQMLAAFVTTELHESVATVADNTVVTLRLPRGIRIGRAFGATVDGETGDVRIPVGAVTAGNTRRVVVELAVNAEFRGVVGEVSAEVDYRSTMDDGMNSLRAAPLAIRAVRTDEEVWASRDMEVWGDFQALLVDEQQELAEQAWREGRTADARRITNAQKAELSQVAALQAKAGIAPSKSIAYQRKQLDDALSTYDIAPESKAGKAVSLQGGALRNSRAKAAPSDWGKKDMGGLGAAEAATEF